jgi:transcription initiation factor TFIIH subunit 4
MISLDPRRFRRIISLFSWFIAARRGQPWTIEPRPESDPKKARDVTFLDKYSGDRWDCLLHYMVGVNQGALSDAGKRLLKSSLFSSSLHKPKRILTRL